MDVIRKEVVNILNREKEGKQQIITLINELEVARNEVSTLISTSDQLRGQQRSSLEATLMETLQTTRQQQMSMLEVEATRGQRNVTAIFETIGLGGLGDYPILIGQGGWGFIFEFFF